MEAEITDEESRADDAAAKTKEYQKLLAIEERETAKEEVRVRLVFEAYERRLSRAIIAKERKRLRLMKHRQATPSPTLGDLLAMSLNPVAVDEANLRREIELEVDLVLADERVSFLDFMCKEGA
jgi:hypothetical protein